MTTWQFITHNLETITFSASLGVVGLGFIALVLVLFLWRSVAHFYREFWAKLGVAFFRFVAAASAIASKSATVQAGTPLTDQPWILTTIIAFVGYLLWEVAGAIGDYKHKLTKEKMKAEYEQEIVNLTQDRDDAERQYLWLARVVSHLRTLANEKLQRVKRVIRESETKRVSLPETRKALAPNEQIGVILETLASLLRTKVTSTGGRYDQNFRVGLYAERDGQLTPIDAFDLNTRSHDPFKSYEAQKDRFRLDNIKDPSVAVRCVLEGRMLIVPDCATHPGFQFFHTQQANYLQSLVAYPIPEFSPDGGNPVRAALLLDTDVPGFFQEEDRENIEITMREFAVRLALEYAIKGLTS